MKLYKRLQYAREAAGIKTTPFAELIGVGQCTIKRLETEAGSKKITFIRIHKWARICGVPAQWIFDGTGRAPDPKKTLPQMKAISFLERKYGNNEQAYLTFAFKKEFCECPLCLSRGRDATCTGWAHDVSIYYAVYKCNKCGCKYLVQREEVALARLVAHSAAGGK